MEIDNFLFGHSRGKYPIDREELTHNKEVISLWSELLNIINCDDYGYYSKEDEHTTKLGGFKCKLFEINPYYWREDENLKVISNFIYSPKGSNEEVTISWYKYPFRDSYANVEIKAETFANILKDCIYHVKVKQN